MKLGKSVLLFGFTAGAVSFLLQPIVQPFTPTNPDRNLYLGRDTASARRVAPVASRPLPDGQAALSFPFDSIEKLTLSVNDFDVQIDPALKGIEITGDPKLISHLLLYQNKYKHVELLMPTATQWVNPGSSLPDSLYQVDSLLRLHPPLVRVGLYRTDFSCHTLRTLAPLRAPEIIFTLKEVYKADLLLETKRINLMTGREYIDTLKTDTIGNVVLRGKAEVLNVGGGNYAKIDARALTLRDAYVYGMENSTIAFAPAEILNMADISGCRIALYSKPRYRRNGSRNAVGYNNPVKYTPSTIVER